MNNELCDDCKHVREAHLDHMLQKYYQQCGQTGSFVYKGSIEWDSPNPYFPTFSFNDEAAKVSTCRLFIPSKHPLKIRELLGNNYEE